MRRLAAVSQTMLARMTGLSGGGGRDVIIDRSGAGAEPFAAKGGGGRMCRP